MKTVLISTTILIVLSFATDRLTGRWETTPSVNGSITGVVFKPDSSSEGYINKKPFVSGNYVFKDDILSFTDNGRDDKEGVYKIIP